MSLVLGALSLWGERAGLYPAAFGIAALALANAVLFAALGWWASTPRRSETARRSLLEEDRWTGGSRLGTAAFEEAAPGAAEGLTSDVTDRRRAEEQIRLQTSALEAAASTIMITDVAGTIAWVNPAFTEMTGYARDEVVGRNPRILRSGHHDRSFYESLWRTILGGGVWAGRMVNRRKDGSVYTEEAKITPVRSDGRHITHFVAVKHDVTEHLQREEALRASKERYRSLFERDLTGVYRATLDGRFLVCNEAFARLYGYDSAAELLTHRAVELHPSREARESFVAELEEHGFLANHEAQGRRKDGRPVWILENVALVYDRDSGSRVIEGTVTDVTDRKRLEEQLRQAHKVEGIGQLAIGIAHDFNNLLSVIQGYADLVLRRLAPDDDLRSKVEQIGEAGRRATALTRQLLAFSRQETPQPTELDLNAVVFGIEPMIRRLIREDVELDVNLCDGPARVRADRGQIEQVILNLAVNAEHAMPDGGRLLLETAMVELDESQPGRPDGGLPGRYARLRVSDSGGGIDEETLPRIFERFFTTKAEGKGTGLGLATVHDIVTQAGGRISVESEPGHGASFRIDWPLSEAELEAAPEVKAAVMPAPRGHEAILLVEDEEALRLLAGEALEALGYTVFCAGNGSQALAMADGHLGTLDLLLTDIVMPEMGGPRLAERLLALRPDLRILFASGNDGDAKAALRPFRPGQGFIAKPYSSRELASKVREVLDAPEARLEGA